MPKTILIIDDEKTIRWSLSEALSNQYDTIDAETAEQGLRLFKGKSPDLILLDMRLPDGSGLEVLQEIKREDPTVPIIMMTAYGEVETAVEAMKGGAYDFILKPYSLDKLRVTITNALETHRLRNEIAYLKSGSTGRNFFKQFIGRSPQMLEIFEKIQKIGQSRANTILITGESGVGKELVARAIHACSYDEPRPFMEINCASVPETLLESELFGYEKGAFTDAKTRKMGLVEMAEGGTMFLDEIGEMGITLQSRLLRVLENKTFRRVGGVKDLHVNTRFVSATNRDLDHAIEEKVFRKDLYYRLKVIPLHIPPVRERKEDIPLLVHFFVDRFNRELGKQVKPVGRDVMEAMVGYDWPGNVRELKNVIERAMLLDAEDEILLQHLPAELRGAGDSVASTSSASVLDSFFPMTLREMERIQIEKTLEQTDGNKSKAAVLLGISRQTLREKLKSFKSNSTPEDAGGAGEKKPSGKSDAGGTGDSTAARADQN
jgi:two-component system response regulator AtoC